MCLEWRCFSIWRRSWEFDWDCTWYGWLGDIPIRYETRWGWTPMAVHEHSINIFLYSKIFCKKCYKNKLYFAMMFGAVWKSSYWHRDSFIIVDTYDLLLDLSHLELVGRGHIKGVKYSKLFPNE